MFYEKVFTLSRKMRIILHSGTHKTATTTFQRICIKYKDLLINDFVYYPSLKPLCDNKYLRHVFKGNTVNIRNFNNHCPVAWLIQKNDFYSINNYFNLVINQARELKCENVLISGEDFENLLIDQDIAKDFSKMLEKIGFNQIDWIFVKRESFSYLKSIYGQLSKHDFIINFKNLFDEANEKGYVTAASQFYTWKFVFDFKDYLNKFEHKVGFKPVYFSFHEFVDLFAGQKLLSRYLSENTIDYLLKDISSLEHANKSLDSSNIEYRYICNFLEIPFSQENYIKNKKIFDPLISYRQKLINSIEIQNKASFNQKFSLD